MSALLPLAIAGVLAGSVPFGLLLTRAAGLGDIRAIGSGNIGATNVLRTGRRGLAAATLLLDVAKGAAPTVVGLLLAGPVGGAIAGLAAVLGHLFTPWLGFRGGKGVATGLGVLLAAVPVAGVLTAAVWLAAARVTRISSAGALAACAAAVPLTWLAGAQAPLIALATAVAVLVTARHHANIGRLLAGTEPRIGA